MNVGDYIEYIPGAGIIEKERTYNALPDETGYGYENEYLKEIPANPNQVFTVDGVTTEMWRVLSIDGENVSIVKEGLIYPNEKPNGLILYASTGYANAKIVLNSVCEIYKNATQSQGTRSINIDDINNLTQFTQQEIEAYGGGSTVKGGYGFENFSGKSTYYQYDGVDKLNDKSSNLYTMIFGNDNKEYWLASECINARTTINAFCTVNCISNGVVRGDELCHTDTSCKNEIAKFVRPVVILKPNLQVTGDGSIQNPWKIN